MVVAGYIHKAIAIGLLLIAATGSNAGVLVSVGANPSAISADGKSSCQILVTVLDQTGAPAPDNTQVRLTASAGDVTPLVYTTGGHAVGILTSSSVPQIAHITASVDNNSASVQVEFSASAPEQETSARGAIRITGGSLAYSVDHDTAMCSGGVDIDCRGIRISAASAQVCQTSAQIRAQGAVTVKRNGIALAADAAAFDVRTGRLSILKSGEEPAVEAFDTHLRPLTSSDLSAKPQDCSSLACSGGRTWITAEQIDIIPADRVLFRGASIYVGESRVIRVPYYVYSYAKRESILQQVRYTASTGILVDLPFYFQMSAARTGALKLRFAGDGSEAGGYWRPRKGLSLGLEQDYFIGDKAHGRIFVDSIGSTMQSYELAHHLDYGTAIAGGRIDISTRFQSHASYARRLHNTSLSVTGYAPRYSYSIYGYLGGSSVRLMDAFNPEEVRYLEQSSFSFRAVVRPRRVLTLHPFGAVSPGLTIGYGSLAGESGSLAQSCLYQSLGAGFNRVLSKGRSTSLSLDGNAALTLTAEGESGTSLRFGPALRTQWKGGSGSLTATANLRNGTTDVGSALARYQLGGSVFLYDGSRFNSVTSAAYGLDSRRMNLFSSLNYRPFGKWVVRSNYSLAWYTYSFNNNLHRFRTSYLKVGVYHPVGLYELGVAWSPDGRDYGVEKDKKLWLELNSSAF